MTPAESVAAFRRLRPLSGPGLVAVSGGPDSVALLRALADADGRGLCVGHFHHQLRGADADADAAFVGELAASLGLPFVQGTADVGAEPGNAEANARRLRYGWLERAAREVGAGWVATGHTLDDQAETILFRLLRGSGVSGLRGIAPARPIRDQSAILLLRPLLRVTKADVMRDLERRGQPYRVDASNADARFTRNRLRRDALPLLAELFPTAPRQLAALAEQASALAADTHRRSKRALRRLERPRVGDAVALDAVGFARLSAILRPEVVRLIWRRERWPAGAMASRHWLWAVAALAGERGGVDLPGGVHARRRGEAAELRRNSALASGPRGG